MRLADRTAARVAGALCACATLAACTEPTVESSGCPDYVQYGSTEDLAIASDLVGQATLDISATDAGSAQQTVRAGLVSVKVGDSGLAGSEISIELDPRCGDSAASVLPDGYVSGDDVILFLVASASSGADRWSLISPTQGIVMFDQSTYDSIGTQ